MTAEPDARPPAAADGATPDEDADALSWAGDDERGLVGPRGGRASRGAARRAGRTGAGAADADGDAHGDTADAGDDPDSGDPDSGDLDDDLDAADLDLDPTPVTPATRALTALALVLFLAWAFGWLLSTQSTAAGSTDLPTQILWQLGEFLAIVAAPLWFYAVVTLTRRAVVRVGWFLLGLGLLLPWPLLLVVVSP